MTSQFKYGLFLSHSWKNKEFVKTFKAKVEAKGVKCWIDTEQMAEINNPLSSGSAIEVP
jgi:hypothetical protein